MAKSLKELRDALDERILCRVRNTKKLTKLYEQLANLQDKSAKLDAELVAVNTEIRMLISSATEVETSISEAVVNLSIHPDFD